MENFFVQNTEDGIRSETIDFQNIEKALLNILDDYSEEKFHSENSQRALLNILDDYSSEKANMEKIQRAVLNILEDYSLEKGNLEKTQRAVLNILEDYSSEKASMEKTQRAVLNILEDYSSEKANLEKTQRAVLNILEDYSLEKGNMEKTQRAVLNILEDFGIEKVYMEKTQRAVLNILEDFGFEKANMERTQRAVLNILEDYSEEKLNLEKIQRALMNILDDYSEEKRKVEVINNELISANIELEQFAYVSSHDLQEPLRTISNFTGLFQKKYSAKFDEEAKLYLHYVLNATTKMQTLIKHLLDFSRIGRNVSFVEVDCNKVLETVVNEMAASIQESDAKINSTPLPVIIGDEIELERLFQNLISNAIKFRKKDVNLLISISVEEKETEYIFAFKDNGIGIDNRFKHKLFTIFQRLHNASEYPGIGIGLATCKKIVELHHGRIWIESKLNEGSTFYFSMPKIKIK